MAKAVAVVPAIIIWIENVPAVALANNVPDVDDENMVAVGVRVGLVSNVVPPEAEIGVVSSVAVFVFVVLISADPFVVPVGVWEGFAMMDRVLVPVPADKIHGIFGHDHAQAFATAGSDQVQIVIGVATVSVISAVT